MSKEQKETIQETVDRLNALATKNTALIAVGFIGVPTAQAAIAFTVDRYGLLAICRKDSNKDEAVLWSPERVLTYSGEIVYDRQR